VSREGTREAKPDAKADTPVAVEPPAAATPTPPPQPLRTAPAGDVAAAERRIKDLMNRASNLLRSIDYKKLNPQHRSAYEQAKDSIDGADIALKASNIELAQQMAEKAEKLARELQAR
jgi:hypothetical protein